MATDLLKEETISVNLEDGSAVEYTLRGLRDDEIGPWSAFCASVFAYKASPPPPAYFERHFYNDPMRDAGLVRVIFCGDDEMVSSCRIFQRTISGGGSGTSLRAGGIGEVCTASHHRRRGLSKILLQDAIRIMTLRGMQISLLHAAPAFFPVYQRSGGYQCVTSEWSVVSINLSKLTGLDEKDSWNVRMAEFPADTARLQELHASFSEQRFAGCIIRSEEYWSRYLSKELEGSLHVLDNEGNVCGWLSLRRRGDRYQLRDFGCDRSKVELQNVLSVLLRDALASETHESASLHLPTAILNELTRESEACSFVMWQTLKTDNDDGWMYKSLQEGETSMPEIVRSQAHLIWPADSF